MTDRESQGSGPRRFGASALAVVLAIGLAAGFGLQYSRGAGTADEAPAEAEEEHAGDLPEGVVEVPETAQRNAGLETLTVARRTLPAAIEVTGVVAPDDARVGHVRPLARGVVEDIAVTLGARVKQGQTLVTYDNIELGELVGNYLSEVAAQRQTEADLEVKQTALKRAEDLVKLEAIAQQTLEQRRSEFKNAQAAVDSQRARVAKVEEQIHRFGVSEAELDKLTPGQGESGHRTSSHSVLRAPFSGVVTKFDVARGELVGPERELMTISDLSTVWVLADVYEKDLAKVRPNSDVTIRVDAYPGRLFSGRLTYVSDIIDPQTRTAKVRCVVSNADGALKLDMFAKVAVATTDSRDAIVIPATAVQQIDGTSVVFIQQTPERFVRRDIELGVSAGDVVEQHAVTTLSLAPTMLAMLLDDPQFSPVPFATLRQVAYGASSLSPDLLRRATDALGVGFAQGYGMTELSGNAVFLDEGGHRAALTDRPHLLQAAGRPSPQVEVRIAPDGEILVRGPQVMAGYWEDPEATAATIEDGWLHTGDLGEIDDEGYVYVVDRAKDIVITGGENVSSREVEDVLADHPDVGQVAVIGVPDTRWGEAVCAVVVPRDGAVVTLEDLVAFTRGRLGGFKQPRRLMVVEALPVNASGKVLKRALRDRAGADA